MKRYFKTLLYALLGRNPFQVELDEVKRQYESADCNVRILNDLYGKMQEKIVAAEKWIISYQKLIENLRESINEKEQTIESLRKDCRERIEQMKVACRSSKTNNT